MDAGLGICCDTETAGQFQADRAGDRRGRDDDAFQRVVDVTRIERHSNPAEGERAAGEMRDPGIEQFDRQFGTTAKSEPLETAALVVDPQAGHNVIRAKGTHHWRWQGNAGETAGGAGKSERAIEIQQSGGSAGEIATCERQVVTGRLVVTDGDPHGVGAGAGRQLVDRSQVENAGG